MNTAIRSNLVSVIIPVFNRPGMVVEAVDSALRQTYRPIEIILIDDGSTDETPRVLAGLAAEQPEAIRVLTTHNQGSGLARETGRLSARGEFIQYLDSDDLLLPDKFAVQIEALQQHPECDIAYGQTRLVSRDRELIEEPYRATGHEIPRLFPLLLATRWWNTHTPLYRRSLCDTIGPWADLRMGEDWEYEARAGALRTRLVYCPQVLSATRNHENRLTTHTGFFSAEYLPGIVQLMKSLLLGACQAGVNPVGLHMRRFAISAWFNSEKAREMGLLEEASEFLNIAHVATSLVDYKQS